MSHLSGVPSCSLNASSASSAIILEERFEQLDDGSLFSPSGLGDFMWQRYVDVLGPVAIIARVAEVPRPSQHSVAITNPFVSVLPIPTFIGPAELALRLPRVLTAMRRAISKADRVILRAPGTLSLLAQPHLKQSGKPFAVELVGDPHDVFSSVGGAASALLRSIFVSGTRRICGSAMAVSYVTRETLQARYPAAPGAFTTNYSTIELPSHVIRSSPRDAASFSKTPFRLLQVGSLEQLYKGSDVLIDAVALLLERGKQVSLRIVGIGRYREQLERQVEKLGLAEAVTFVGALARDQVFEEMDRCDMLVHPSRTEGLPRTVIEAFARATPVVGSRVGGIPELVPDPYLVPPGDPSSLADAIANCMGSREELESMSRRNIGVADEYRADVLAARRRSFYEAVALAGAVEPIQRTPKK